MAFATASSVAASDAPWRVTATRYSDDVGGFRCAFRSPTADPNADPSQHKLLLQVDDDSLPKQRGLVAINGKKHLLRGTSLQVRAKRDGLVSVGDKLVETLTDDEVAVTLKATITKLCPPDEESCEVTYYRATVTVTYAGASRTFPVAGECGS